MRKNYWLLIFFLAALKMVLPFLLQHSAFGLHRDEYLYYEQGQHLAWGYLENPALIGLLGKLSSWAGGSFFWIKLWPALFGAATLLLTTAIARELGGRIFALVIASFGLLFSAYLRIHFLFQPNFLEIFSWTLSAFFLVRYLRTHKDRYLYFLCTALALGWWSKYSVLFFAAGVFLALLATRQRTVFTNKHFWGAALLGLMLVTPNIIWQGLHQCPLLHHMAELRETQLQYVSTSTFLKEQVLLLLPVAFVWMGGLIWLLRHKQYRVIGLTFLLVVSLIALGKGKGYYTLGAYPMLLAAGGVWLERITEGRKVLRFVLAVALPVLGLPFVPLLLPLQPPLQMAATNKQYQLANAGLLRWEDLKDHPLQQDFADMIGWDELAGKAEKAYQQLPPREQQQTVVYCRNYGQAGAVKYHAQNDAFRRKVICDNGTFLLWIPNPLQFKNLLFVGHDMPEKDDAVFQHFSEVRVVDSVTNPLSRQYGNKIIYFRNASDSALILANQGLAEMRAVFGE